MVDIDSSHYEIFIKVGDHWEIQARYPATQKDVAVEEARTFERAMNAPVKVSHETFDAASGLYKGNIIYRTDDLYRDKGPAEPDRHGGGDDDWDYPEDDTLPTTDEDGYFIIKENEDVLRKKKRAAADHKVRLIRVGVMTLLSLLVSIVVTFILSSSPPKLNALKKLFGMAVHADVLLVTFIGMFAVSFVALSLVFLSDFILPPEPQERKREDGGAKTPEITPEESTAQWLKEREAEDSEAEAEHEEIPPVPEEEPEAMLAEKNPAAPEGLSADGESPRRLMLSFMNMIREEIAVPPEQLDTFNRFGVNLFLAGAAESLGKDKGLPHEDIALILAEAVVQVGTGADQAVKFAEAYENYLLNARYMEMFETGRMAVNSFLEDDSDGARRLKPAMVLWNEPKKEKAPSGAVAVMFTDMVGSSDLNQTLGDVVAQHVVHTHNRIVRQALQDYYGREVKHMGDGIMASFTNTANAVKAGLVIQKRVLANNQAEKDIPLHLRIGINVGEPIVEEDDLFGITVQFAARLCAACEMDRVLVSESVKALCAGKDISFVDKGTRNLKGLPEPVHVFEPTLKG